MNENARKHRPYHAVSGAGWNVALSTLSGRRNTASWWLKSRFVLCGNEKAYTCWWPLYLYLLVPNHDLTMQHSHSVILVKFLNLLEQLVSLLKAQPILAAREQKGQNSVAMIFVQEFRYLDGKMFQ